MRQASLPGCVLILAAALTGCIDPGGPPENLGAEADLPLAWTSLTRGATVTAVRLDGEVGLSLTWGLDLRPIANGQCDLSGAASGFADDRGPRLFISLAGPDVETNIMPWPAGNPLEQQIRIEAFGAVELVEPDVPFPWHSRIEVRNHSVEKGTLYAFRLAAADLAVHPDGPDDLADVPLSLVLTCNVPFEVVSKYGGTEAYFFHEATMRGGASAHVSGAFNPTGLVVVSKAQAGLTGEWGTAVVRLYGDVLLMHAGTGMVRVSYPHGEQVILDRPSAMLVEYGILGNPFSVEEDHSFHAGPGDYVVEVTWTSLEVTGILDGLFFSVDEVP